jgi:purine-cytosine permease-like protein
MKPMSKHHLTLNMGKAPSRGEDFALAAVPAVGARHGVMSLFFVALGIPSALVFFSVGGALELAYGTVALVTGLVVASVIIGVAAWILTSVAVRTGLDSDLLSAVAGFGLFGSGVTSGIYSANFIVLFALEDGIISDAVHSRLPGLPRVVLLPLLGILVLALTWRGMGRLAQVMRWTLPVFIALMTVAVVRTGVAHKSTPGFWSYTPHDLTISTSAWLSVLAALLAFIVNATVAADVGRFVKWRQRRVGVTLFAVVLQTACFGGATLLGAWFALRRGTADPGGYLVALLGGWGVLCVLLSQTRINMINAYSGSLSLSNFGLRLLQVRPGRQTWMTLMVVVSTLLALTNIYQHLLGVLSFEAVFVMAWVSTLIAYIVSGELNSTRAEAITLEGAEAINYVGLGALALSLGCAVPLAFGVLGDLGRSVAPLVACTLAPVGVLMLRRVASKRRIASVT